MTFELYDPNGADQTVMGYGLSSAGAAEINGAEQVQRWILFSRDGSDFFPTRTLQIRRARDTLWKGVTDKSTFIRTARAQFRSTQDRYVKANCAYVRNQATMGRPLPLPLLLNTAGGGS